MSLRARWAIALGLLIGVFLIARAPSGHNVVEAQTLKPVMMTHLFTGPDGQTHAEEIEAKFAAGEISKLLQLTGGELHRYPPGYVNDWHPAPRRQYVITLSGRGEIELAGGQKIPAGPGHIEFVEDITGKGHITRVVGSDGRVTLQLPIAADAMLPAAARPISGQ